VTFSQTSDDPNIRHSQRHKVLARTCRAFTRRLPLLIGNRWERKPTTTGRAGICDGYRPGDRVFDLVTLAFCLAVAERPTAAEQRLWETIKRMRDSVVVNAYVAHQALRQVDWSIRYRTPDDLEAWMARSTALLA